MLALVVSAQVIRIYRKKKGRSVGQSHQHHTTIANACFFFVIHAKSFVAVVIYLKQKKIKKNPIISCDSDGDGELCPFFFVFNKYLFKLKLRQYCILYACLPGCVYYKWKTLKKNKHQRGFSKGSILQVSRNGKSIKKQSNCLF